MSGDHEDATHKRAYALWEQEGRPERRSLDHWLTAQAEFVPGPPAGVLDDRRPAKSSRTRRKVP